MTPNRRTNCHEAGHGTLTSQTIDLLRFPLIVGVVLIHGSVMDSTSAQCELSFPICVFIQRLLSETVTDAVVPTFFTISGYLFFHNTGDFTPGIYLRKLRRRLHTLAIPYLFWSLLAAAAIFLLSHIPQPLHCLPAGSHSQFPQSIWATEATGAGVHLPLVIQFWFLRDLMVCVAISPLLYRLTCHTRHIGLLLLLAAWYAGWELPVVGQYGISMTAMLFFSIGAWCARYRSDLVGAARSVRILGWIWPVAVALHFIPMDGWLQTFIQRTMVLSGVILFVCAGAYAVEHCRLKAAPLLSASSFFIYACHYQWIQNPLRRILLNAVEPSTDIEYLAIYLSLTALTVAIAIAIYCMLRKTMPRLTGVITGGRI